jgi:hypothetical protein
MARLAKLDAELHDRLDVAVNREYRILEPFEHLFQGAQQLVPRLLNTEEILAWFRGRYDPVHHHLA